MYSLYRLESSTDWKPMRQQQTFPGFFKASWYLSRYPKDTFMKLPVSEKPSGVDSPLVKYRVVLLDLILLTSLLFILPDPLGIHYINCLLWI